MLEIPLTSDGEQKFNTILDGVLYDLRILYNTRLNLWTMDISSSGSDIANGVALVQGGDIMSPYNNGPSNLFVVNTTGSNSDAGPDNLGTEVKLFQLTAEELDSVTSV